jgi:hypothetical protein
MSVARRLADAGFAHAVIGAAALAVHGHSRSTDDLDLLVADTRVLRRDLWPDGQVRVGDADDPLAGVVRVPGPIDIVVIEGRWAAGMIERAVASGLVMPIDGVPVPVVDAADLVLLKLYAGGAPDLRDAELLLGNPGVPDAVRSRLSTSPPVCAAVLERVRG